MENIFTSVCIDVAQNSQNFAVALQSKERQMPLSESQKWHLSNVLFTNEPSF